MVDGPPQSPSPSSVAQYTATSYSGPLPPAAQLQEYDRIVLGLADRIVAQWERQTSHRQEIERTVIQNQVRLASIGQWVSAVVALAGMGTAGLLIYTGNSVQGFSLVVGELIGLAGLFVYQKRRESFELARKREALQTSMSGPQGAPPQHL